MTLVSRSMKIIPFYLLVLFALLFAGPVPAEPADPKLSNDRCLRCHGREGFSRDDVYGNERDLHVTAAAFGNSVHGQQDCVGCHQDITKAPHRKGIDRKVSCVTCHVDLWDQAQANGTVEEHARLGVVVEQIESYMNSMHARPNLEDQSRTNATCYDCHDAHYISQENSLNTPESKLRIPYTCGSCHSEVLDTYMTSVHGKEIGSGNARAAVCTDCHSAHNIDVASDEPG